MLETAKLHKVKSADPLMLVELANLTATEITTIPVKQVPQHSETQVKLSPLEREILAAYIEAWVDLKFKAVPDSHALNFGREQDGVLPHARRNLQSLGYLVVEQATRALEPSSKAFGLHENWTSSRLAISINGLAKQIQPNSEFTLVHANARHSFLTVLSKAQAYGDVTLEDLTRILGWTKEDTIFWARDLKNMGLIVTTLRGESYLLSTGHTPESLSSLSTLSVPFAVSKNLLTPEMARSIIPDLIYHLCKPAEFSLGITSGELGKALLVLGYSRNSPYYLAALVDQGIIKVKVYDPIRGDIELGRLSQPTKLYSIVDPNFKPTNNCYDLKDMPQKFMDRRATGALKGVFECKRAGQESFISTEEIYRVASSMSQHSFELMPLKAELEKQSIRLARSALEVILDTMISEGKIARHTPTGKQRRKFMYNLIK